jgi:hypothetical protein
LYSAYNSLGFVCCDTKYSFDGNIEKENLEYLKETALLLPLLSVLYCMPCFVLMALVFHGLQFNYSTIYKQSNFWLDCTGANPGYSMVNVGEYICYAVDNLPPL